MGVLKDGSSKDGEMGLAVVAVQILAVVRLVTVDVVDATAEWAHISAVVLTLDDEINGGLFCGKTLMEIKNSHSSSSLLT